MVFDWLVNIPFLCIPGMIFGILIKTELLNDEEEED